MRWASALVARVTICVTARMRKPWRRPKRVLEWLQKKAYLQPDDPLLLDPDQDPIWCTWMSARSTPIPIWHRSGAREASQ